MDKTTKGLLIALGAIVALAVGMNFASKVINDIAEIKETQERVDKANKAYQSAST